MAETGNPADQPGVSHGVLRGRQALIGLDRPLRGLRLKVELGGSGAIRQLDPTPAEPPAVDGWPAHTFAAILPDGDVAGVVPVTVDGREVTTGPGYLLTTLLPLDRADLSRCLFRRRTRIQDAETRTFMLDQLMRSPVHRPQDRLEAVKILSYSRLESLDPAAIATVLGLVKQGFHEADRLPHETAADRDASNRESRHHARVSLRTIRWHASLLLGRFEEAFVDALWLLEALPAAADCPSAAANASRVLVAYGEVLRTAGDDKAARRAFDSVIAYFRAAAAGMPSQPLAAFREIGLSFDAAKAAADAISRLRRADAPGPVAEELDFQRLGDEFFRLSTPASRRAYAAALAAAAAHLSLRRGLAVRTGRDRPAPADLASRMQEPGQAEAPEDAQEETPEEAEEEAPEGA